MLRVKGELGVSITKLPFSVQAKIAVETSKMGVGASHITVHKRSRVLGEHLLTKDPELADHAKDILQSDGWEGFKREFGTHYVKGEIRGAAIDIYKIFKSDVTTDNFHSNGSMNIGGSYSVINVKLSGDLNLENSKKSSQEKIVIKVK